MNEMSRRAVPTNLHSPQHMNFGETHSYSAHRSVESILATDGFFNPVQGRLKTGDRIVVCYVEGNRVREMQELLVVSSERGSGVEILSLGRRISVPRTKPAPPQPKSIRGKPEYRIEHNEQTDKWLIVFAETGKFVSQHDTEDEAKAEMAELME